MKCKSTLFLQYKGEKWSKNRFFSLYTRHSIVFDDDDLTAISEAVKRADAESNLIYDLNGNIVNNPQKGHIYKE